METKASNMSSSQPLKDTNRRDFLNHLEAYLAKRDGVDKLLKISRYATKIILASSLLPDSPTLTPRLKSFESSVGLSRKAFRLGKFVQDLNALRLISHSSSSSTQLTILSIIAYGAEGFYYFVEQFVWLAKSGLIDPKHSPTLQKISAWAEFIGYIGSIGLKFRDLRAILEDQACLTSTMEISFTRGEGVGCSAEEKKKMGELRRNKLMKQLSVVQDVADALMALSDIRDLSAPLLLSGAGLLSALISTHKNWLSC